MSILSSEYKFADIESIREYSLSSNIKNFRNEQFKNLNYEMESNKEIDTNLDLSDIQNLNELLELKEELRNRVAEIQVNCEGIENLENAKKISNLNNEKSKIIAKRNKIEQELSSIENRLNLLNSEINSLSSNGIDRILDAIGNQRYYLLKNNPKIIVDIKTGAIITNLDYFTYKRDDGDYYSVSGAKHIIKNLNIEGYKNWNFIERSYLYSLMNDTKFPSRDKFNDVGYWTTFENSNPTEIKCISKGSNSIWDGAGQGIIACSYDLKPNNYEVNIQEQNKIYTKKEKLQMSLSLFEDNNLEPIFKDKEITKLYRSIYIEKPILLNKLNEIQQKIDELQNEALLSSTFDYNRILMNYDINLIDSSIIKYYEAIQNWIDDLVSKLQYFEDEKWDIIKEFNVCGLKLCRKYEENPKLDEEENILLKNRQAFLRKNIDLGMGSVKTKLLAVKNQADILESRIEEINNSESSITLLAELEQEKRASFKFIAENTANIIKKALIKVEYFEANKDFVTNIINSEAKWSETYKVFKTKDKEELKSLSEEDGVEEDVYMSWYQDWRNKKYILEKSFTELIEQGIKKSIVSVIKDNDESKYMIEEVINILEIYSENINSFYKNERKNIHQKYAFIPGGDIQEKLEVESELYKITCKFQSDLQNIIFKLNSVEERIFLLKWAEEIIDLQVNEVLYFVKDKDFNKISENILNQFADLKRSNIENYILDAQLYSEEKCNREKQFNSLMYKMRKELMA